MVRESIVWFFNQIAYLTEQALSWKLIGNFSLLHFILGFNFIIILFSFYKFGIESSGDMIGSSINRFGNDENRKDKLYFKVQGYTPKHNSGFYTSKHVGTSYRPRHDGSSYRPSHTIGKIYIPQHARKD